MDLFNNAPDIVLDLILLQLNEEDLNEALRVSKSWFWASVRRIKKLKITSTSNPLKTMANFYNNHAGLTEEAIDWHDLFEHLVLNELNVSDDKGTVNYLVNHGCNTAILTIQGSRRATPVTVASLKRFTRLQSFELHTYWDVKWHPFLIECFQSSDIMFDPNTECPIYKIKLNSGGWNTEGPVLVSVTKLSVSPALIDFIRTMVDHCPNLEEIDCFEGSIGQEWHHVFPVNLKTIELHEFNVDSDVARVVDASTNAGRNLLPYLCQNLESVEKFHFDGYIDGSGETVYEVFPQEREEVFMCGQYNNAINLGGPLFQSREISVKCDGSDASELTIPPAKSVKLEFLVRGDFNFSPRAVCEEPGQVEHLSLSLTSANGFTINLFGQSSFEGFCRLTSLTLSHVSELTIRMALDQCPSIKTLKLNYLKASTFGKLPRGSSYSHVYELVLDECKEPICKVFKVFPCLSKFKYSAVFNKQKMRKKTDLLRRHLIEEDKKYGVVFESETEIRFMVSGDLQASLNEAQTLLKECFQSKCFLKGFKLIPRAFKQKVCYIK